MISSMSAEDISPEALRIEFSSIVLDAHADTPQRFLFDRFDLGMPPEKS
jgi:hypothetical protein